MKPLRRRLLPLPGCTMASSVQTPWRVPPATFRDCLVTAPAQELAGGLKKPINFVVELHDNGTTQAVAFRCA